MQDSARVWLPRRATGPEGAAALPLGPQDVGVSRWLFFLWGLVLAMVVVGGITRLTGSGLSIAQWRPLMGTLPPITEADWQHLFSQYQQTPQFEQVNHWMSLADFRRIFFWEYLHRLLGRFVGLAFALPFVYFLVRRRLAGRAMRVVLAFALGGAQGVLGWYMVRSGLVDVPQVSHLRLAAHLGLAFSVGGYLLWLALDARPRVPLAAGRPRQVARLFTGSVLLWPLIGLQVLYGALMAGTGAGRLFSTFPDMGGRYFPAIFFRFPTLVGNLLYNPLAIHWIHRALGVAVAAAVVALVVLVRLHTPSTRASRLSAVLLGLTVLQIALGAAMILNGVPPSLAVVHQGCAYLLFSAAIGISHSLAHQGPPTIQ